MNNFSPLNTPIVSAILTIVLATAVSPQTTSLNALCEKYIFDCPLTVNQDSHWNDIMVARELLREYLTGNNKWVTEVSFDGSEVIVRGTARVSILDRRSDQEIKNTLSEKVKLETQHAFVQSKTIVVVLNISRSAPADTVVVSRANLKQKYFKPGGAIDYDEIWSAVINAIGQVQGFELDSPSLVRRQDYGKVSTLPVISQENGFVKKYFVTVEMSQPSWQPNGTRVQVETLLKVWRKRASASNSAWSEITVGGDSVGGSQAGIRATTSSMPVFNKIKEAIQQ